MPKPNKSNQHNVEKPGFFEQLLLCIFFRVFKNLGLILGGPGPSKNNSKSKIKKKLLLERIWSVLGVPCSLWEDLGSDFFGFWKHLGRSLEGFFSLFSSSFQSFYWSSSEKRSRSKDLLR